MKNTIDDIMWDTVQHKLTNVGRVLDGKEDSLAVSHLRVAGFLGSILGPSMSSACQQIYLISFKYTVSWDQVWDR